MAYIDLDGEWLTKGYAAGSVSADAVLQESGDEPGWYPAQVPGEVHLDLQRAGVIPDPFYRDNETQTQWVHEMDWWFRREFSVDPQLLENDRVELVCDGLDTFATIYLNGQPVATADNMLRTWRFDARPFLRGGDNEIAIGFHAPHAACQELAAQYGAHRGGFNVPEIVQARKAQYSAGWDWGPFLTSIGIWRSIRIDCWSNARLQNTFVHAATISEAHALVEVEVNIEATTTLPVTVGVGLAPFVGDLLESATLDLTLQPGPNRAVVSLPLENPQLWWPVGYGDPTRYRAEIQITGAGVNLATTQPFGLRTVELIREPDEDGESFVIAVNGVQIYCKGANWIPGDQFLPRISEEHYRRHIALALSAGMNMLRVWGGGIYEAPIFYDLCDAQGLMVWQDFLFACGSYPEYAAFRENVTAEATEAIQQLRNHPALVIWCGNNENHWLFPPDQGYQGHIYYDEILPELCAELDPTRPYWNGSPYARYGEPANSMTSGDRHSWDVWGGYAHDAAYLLDTGRFISEFGFQAPPTLHLLEDYLEPEDQVPWSPVMELHQKMPEKQARLYRYLALHFPVPAQFHWWIYATQANQCLVLNRAISHWRARKWRTAGTLLWQLNDCWPVASWSIVDYSCRPKPAWYEVKRAFTPLLLTIQPVIPTGNLGIWDIEKGTLLETLDRAIYLVNDTMQEVHGHVRLRAMDFQGNTTWEQELPVALAANSAQQVSTLARATLGDFRPMEQVLVAELQSDDGQTLARDLHWYAEPKHLRLPVDLLQAEWTDSCVSITASQLALFVEVDAGAGIPSDNFFHLLPGEERIITFDWPIEQIIIRSLADLLHLR